MQIVDLVQGSDAWLEYRRMRIMATDSSIILRLNPWCTPLELYWQKMQLIPAIEQNSAMKRGSDLEPVARQIFMDEFDIPMTPCVVESDEYFWAAASLDGLSNCHKYVLEIKCPNFDTHRFAVQGSIKPYYMAQIQHQLFVTRSEKAFYWSYHPDAEIKTAMIEVYPDLEYIDKMIDLEREFYEYNLCGMNEPLADWAFKLKMDFPK